MPLNNHILNVVEHSLELDTIKFNARNEDKGGDKISHEIGGPVPMVVINGLSFSDSNIKRFELDCTSKIPKINIVIQDISGLFSSDTMPRDGDVISIRLAARQQDTFKDIRIDFDIDEVSGPPSRALESAIKGSKYIIDGTMKIPSLYSEGCKSYSGTSREQVEEFATTLNLGLATNIDTSDDKMKALNACQPNIEFLDNLILHSYVGEESFQTYSIDPYYNINFVDVNALLNSEEGLDDTYLNMQTDFDEGPYNGLFTKSKTGSNKIEIKNILTNAESFKSTNNFIESYKLINNSGALSKKNGYKRKLIFFENDSEGNISFDMEPLASSNMKDIEEPLKGRRGEDRYQKEMKSKYVGRLPIQSDDEPNVHLNYSYAAISNQQNLDEMNKMKLEIKLSTWNPGLHLWQKIPVQILKAGKAQVDAAKGINKDKDEKGFDTDQEIDETAMDTVNQVKDEFLTAFYVIGGIKYCYKESEGITQILTLLRREWPSRLGNITEETMAEETPPPTPPEPTPEPPAEPEVEEVEEVEEPTPELEELEIQLSINKDESTFIQSEDNYFSISGTWSSNRDFEGFTDIEIEFEGAEYGDYGAFGYPQVNALKGENELGGTWEFKGVDTLWDPDNYKVNITTKAEDKEFKASINLKIEDANSYTYELIQTGPNIRIVVYNNDNEEVYRGDPRMMTHPMLDEGGLVNEARSFLDPSGQDAGVQNMKKK